jgi:ferredoxin
MVDMRISVDLELCVGAGMCVRTAPSLFDQDPSDGTVILLTDGDIEGDLETARLAVDVCPSGALSLIDAGA